jgi:flagellar biosynthesis/type III secretory pathway protein FliH
MEALGRIPRPGEHLFLRVHPAESALWAQLAEGEQQVCKVALVEDEDIARGSCFVEVEGLRLDLGSNSRRALVRQALGLPLDGDD